MNHPEGSGIDPKALQRFVDEQVYSLPGIADHRRVLTVLLTGSRAAGTYSRRSDVDVDVLCPARVYPRLHRAAYNTGLITSTQSFFRILGREKDWHRYFGKRMGVPHFCVRPIERVAREFRDYEDVPLWIWTNAKVIADPHRQFRKIVGTFKGYPKPMLIRKIKYRWLLSAYWLIDCFPLHHSSENELLPAASGIVNAVNELLRFFFLVEGKPFPYAEKLMSLAPQTKLGRRFAPMLGRAVNLVVGKAQSKRSPWTRLKKAFEMLACSHLSADCRQLEDACAKAILRAGVEPEWVKTDYSNIDELLSGRLGSMP